MLIRGRQPFHMVGQTAEIQVKCGPHSKIVQYMRMHVEGKGYFLRQFAGQIKIIWRAECDPRAVGWLRLQSRSRTPVYYDSVSSFRHRHLTIFRQFDTNQGKKQLNLIKKKLIITERYTALWPSRTLMSVFLLAAFCSSYVALRNIMYQAPVFLQRKSDHFSIYHTDIQVYKSPAVPPLNILKIGYKQSYKNWEILLIILVVKC